MGLIPTAVSVLVLVLVVGLTVSKLMPERVDIAIPQQAPALSIAVNPAVIDAVRGQTTTVTFTNTVKVYKPRVEVRNSSGATIRTLASWDMIGTNTFTRVWDGKNTSGKIVADGVYTVIFYGNNANNTPLTPAVANVTVTTNPAGLSLRLAPNAIDPSKGQTTTVTFSNTIAVYQPRVEVRNGSGAIVRTLGTWNLIGSNNTLTRTWDGKDTGGQIVPDGVYTVIFTGNAVNGAVLTPASANVTVLSVYAFAITGITPGAIDPRLGEITTIAYTVPTTCDLRVYVTNNAGTEVRILAQVTGAVAGARTATWDAKDGTGIVVPNGNYTVTVERIGTTPAITPASGTITVQASPPPAFTITSIQPATIDPTKGDSAAITYQVPITADYRLYVKNEAGTTLRTLRQETAAVAGTYTASWDAKDGTGVVAPDGTYTVTIEGNTAFTTLVPASGTVSVSASPPAFVITSIVPATIYPTTGGSTTITYEVPVVADYRLYVKTAAGNEVRILLQQTAGAAGTHTVTWDAKDSAGAVVPDGAYTVTIEGINAFVNLIPASATVNVLASPPPAFTITSISPVVIDPTIGENTTITFEVPVTADYRVYVRNAAGTEVRTLVQQTAGAAGSHTATWDARDIAGAVLPDGTYTVTIEGINASTNITSASGTVDVSASPPPTYAFSIVSIVPATIDPTIGGSATVTYDVPIACDLRVFVKNAAGVEVRTLTSVEGAPAGARTSTWDAKGTTGAVVPDGTYTVTVEGINAFTNFTPASGTVSVSASPPPVYAFTITGIVPVTIDPTKAETTTITYEVPVIADYRVYVKDNAGTEVRNLLQVNAGAAGTATATWDAKNDAGEVVPDGTYTVIIEGLNASAAITPASGTVSVSASPPPTYAFTITGIVPATVDPTIGESATISFDVPIVADYRLYVKDGTGTEIRTLQQETAAAAGAQTATWDAKDAAGAVVPDGTYIVVIEGLNASAAMTPASGTVAVATSPLDLGQIVEGAGSSNFDALRVPGYKLDVAFRAPRDGAITQITLQWKSSSGYGAGNKGVYRFELQTDGDGHFPSGTVIASTDGVIPSVAMDGLADGAFHFPISATLVRGVKYHLVVTNTAENPGSNWSSPNGLMTRVQPWDGAGNRAAIYSDGQWRPYSSTHNPWNTTGSNFVNGHHIPTMLTWEDGSNTGDPYYTSRLSAGAYFYGNACAGQRILWDGPSVSIHRIGISVKRIGTPDDNLVYHFEQIGVGELATGVIASPDQVGTVQQWCYAELPAAVTLEQGQAYRLWFESPRSKNSSNCYFTSPVYGEVRPAAWLECGWGGTHCYYIYGSGNPSSSLTTADLSFSLQ